MLKYVLALMLVLAQAPAPPEDYPGQREHQQPPPGWFCAHHDTVHAKACGCKRMNQAEDCETGPITEDRACRVWCHPTFCRCPVNCKPTNPEAPEGDPMPENGPEQAMHKH